MDTALTKRNLIAQIATLELEDQQVSARRRKLHDRIAIFPSEAQERAERQLSDYRRDLYRRIQAAHVALATLRNAERRASESKELSSNSAPQLVF